MDLLRYVRLSGLLSCVCFIVVAVAQDGNKWNKPSSLGLDPRSSTFLKKCVDAKRECRYWILSGKCRTNNYIRKKCPKSCGLCSPTSTSSPSMSTHFSTAAVKTATEEPATTHLILQTTRLGTVTKEGTTRIFFTTTSTIKETTAKELKTVKSTTSQGYTKPNSYAKYSKSGMNVAMVTGVAVVSCISVTAVVIFLFVFKRRKNRSVSLRRDPASNIMMQPFNYTSESSRKTGEIKHEELYGNTGTLSVSQTQLTNNDLKENEPFYHVLEKTSSCLYQNQPMYACADSNSNENEAFDLVGPALSNEARHEVVAYETVTCMTGNGHEKPTNRTVFLNNVMENAGKPPKDIPVTMETHYYHVLEKNDSEFREIRDDSLTPVYQSLVGATKSVRGNSAEHCNVYQPLTGIRFQGKKNVLK